MSGPTSRRDPRVFIYAALDLIYVIAFVFVLARVAPPLRGFGNIFWAIALVYGICAVAMLLRRRIGWRLAVGGCASLLLLEVAVLTLLLSSAAFLSGVYGAFGRSGAGLSVLAAFLSIQIVALVPGLQLKFLLTRAGRRAFTPDTGVARE